MSVEPNYQWFETAHHELGHGYYFIAYSRPEVPPLLRDGANPSFHEGIGELISLATRQVPYLKSAGVLPADLSGFLKDCRAMDLSPVGLMCIPPEDQDSTPHFAMLARMAADHGLNGLSMGMSSDFEAAVAQGATHIRVGSAIFGARTYA